MNSRFIQAGRFRLPLTKSDAPLVMGIVNVTPDSFSQDGLLGVHRPSSSNQITTDTIDHVISHATWLVESGAQILDIGAESTRPHSKPVPSDVEWQRLEPILKELLHWAIPISVDTYKPDIMRRALDMGVDMINDIQGFRTQAAQKAVKGCGAALVIMHMQGTPRTMQISPHYESPYGVIDAIEVFFEKQQQVLKAQGINAEQLIFDPGIGFGKTVMDNLTIFKNITALSQRFSPSPLLIGASRKSFLGIITGREVQDRLAATIASTIMACERGAKIIRVHDVAETIDAIKVWQAMRLSV